MNKFVKLAAAAAVAITTSTSAFAADHNLTISSWTGPGHGINAIMWPNLIKMIEEATDGKVSAEVKLGLAPPPAQMDLVMDGAADLTIIFHGYQPGRFVGTKLIELPGYEGNAEAASVAIALGHPLGMSGGRLALTAAIELANSGAKRALCTMCIGVGQGIALMLERVE